ncbi:MAG: RNA polymerase sigma factor [Planctomycetota bacterium]
MTQAELFLLEQIRQGDGQAWEQLINRYQGRLTAYAQGQIRQRADAEDAVQETFVNFVRSLNAFRAQCSLESYLFTILRRKIYDTYRKKARHAQLIQNSSVPSGIDESSDYMASIPSDDPTASCYVRRDEQKERMLEHLSKGILSLLDKIKQSLNFEHLKAVELLFYCQLSNTETARILEIDAGKVGLIKHRCIKQIQSQLNAAALGDLSEGDFEGLLAQVWQQYRPSCPKRSTLGGYLLKTVEPDWLDYIDFHLNQLGCHYCQANFEDLQLQNQQKGSDVLSQRIMESTVGFLKVT